MKRAMFSRLDRWAASFLVGACLLHSFFLIQNLRKAAESVRLTRGLSNPERRFLQDGNWYYALLAVENQIPLEASVRLVSPAPPWYLAYYLYPRLLRRGSEALTDRDLVRKRYPDDWVLVYSEIALPEMTAYPPLAGAIVPPSRR